jgi:hypothetical protein
VHSADAFALVLQRCDERRLGPAVRAMYGTLAETLAEYSATPSVLRRLLLAAAGGLASGAADAGSVQALQLLVRMAGRAQPAHFFSFAAPAGQLLITHVSQFPPSKPGYSVWMWLRPAAGLLESTLLCWRDATGTVFELMLTAQPASAPGSPRGPVSASLALGTPGSSAAAVAEAPASPPAAFASASSRRSVLVYRALRPAQGSDAARSERVLFSSGALTPGSWHYLVFSHAKRGVAVSIDGQPPEQHATQLFVTSGTRLTGGIGGPVAGVFETFSAHELASAGSSAASRRAGIQSPPTRQPGTVRTEGPRDFVGEMGVVHIVEGVPDAAAVRAAFEAGPLDERPLSARGVTLPEFGCIHPHAHARAHDSPLPLSRKRKSKKPLRDGIVTLAGSVEAHCTVHLLSALAGAGGAALCLALAQSGHARQPLALRLLGLLLKRVRRSTACVYVCALVLISC